MTNVKRPRLRGGGLWVGAIQLSAALAIGLVAWAFGVIAAQTQERFASSLAAWPWWTAASAPLLFVAAAWQVRRFAPEAKGSGVPQVLQAVKIASPGNVRGMRSPLVSLKTAVVKIASASTGFLGGASIGEEGPIVQIGASIGAFAARIAGRKFQVEDWRGFLVAGAAAGIAAAFNTPLAGITFALEEIAERRFSSFKSVVVASVIVAVFAKRTLGGDYLYFGHPDVQVPSAPMLGFAVLVGLLGGGFGGLFAKILTRARLKVLPGSWWIKALLCGSVCSVIACLSSGATSGSGYDLTKAFVDGPNGTMPALFFPEKFLSTVFSYLSGMAGGIFSPCLAIGAGLGVDAAQWLHMTNLKACALVGMVAFFSGVVHAPLTAAVIVMEMTNQQVLIIPFLVGGYTAYMVGKLFMPVPLYRHMAFEMEALEKESV